MQEEEKFAFQALPCFPQSLRLLASQMHFLVFPGVDFGPPNNRVRYGVCASHPVLAGRTGHGWDDLAFSLRLHQSLRSVIRFLQVSFLHLLECVFLDHGIVARGAFQRAE